MVFLIFGNFDVGRKRPAGGAIQKLFMKHFDFGNIAVFYTHGRDAYCNLLSMVMFRDREILLLANSSHNFKECFLFKIWGEE